MSINLDDWKARKKILGLKYEDIAQKADVSLNTVKNIFRGATPDPRLETVQRIEQVLGLEEDKKNSPTELSAEEKALLDLFNRVPEDKQELVLQMIQVALKSQE